MAFTETWLTAADSDASLDMTGFGYPHTPGSGPGGNPENAGRGCVPVYQSQMVQQLYCAAAVMPT